MTHNKVAWTFEKFSHMLSNRSVSIANFPKFSADTMSGRTLRMAVPL